MILPSSSLLSFLFLSFSPPYLTHSILTLNLLFLSHSLLPISLLLSSLSIFSFPFSFSLIPSSYSHSQSSLFPSSLSLSFPPPYIILSILLLPSSPLSTNTSNMNNIFPWAVSPVGLHSTRERSTETYRERLSLVPSPPPSSHSPSHPHNKLCIECHINAVRCRRVCLAPRAWCVSQQWRVRTTFVCICIFSFISFS